jgi:hypothetical protein
LARPHKHLACSCPSVSRSFACAPLTFCSRLVVVAFRADCSKRPDRRAIAARARQRQQVSRLACSTVASGWGRVDPAWDSSNRLDGTTTRAAVRSGAARFDLDIGGAVEHAARRHEPERGRESCSEQLCKPPSFRSWLIRLAASLSDPRFVVSTSSPHNPPPARTRGTIETSDRDILSFI